VAAADRARRQKVAVIGAGGIGGFVASELLAAGHHVTLCVRTPIDRLVVEEAGQRREAPVAIATDPAAQTAAAWIFVTTKAQDAASAAGWLARLADAASVVVVLQNGIDHAARVAPFVRGATILPALSYMAVERVARGHIVHHKGRQIIVPAGPAAAALSALVEGSSLDIVQEADFTTAAWRKLLSNLVANPITALTLQRIGVIQDPDIKALARGVLREGAVVAAAEGARLTSADADAVLDEFASYSPDGGSSMLYDRLAGRPLEHEFLTGAVVRAAERHHIDAPLNRALLALLRALDRTVRPS
jgi:2-dehydropantoate 2-reductase